MEIEKIHCAAKVENLAGVSDFVEGCAGRFGLADKKKFAVLIVIEEAFVNICSYAYPGGDGQVELGCGSNGDAFVVEIADSGSPFDILTLPDPDTSSPIMERQIGGLGIHFIRTLADSVSYRRENDQNILRMVFRRIPSITP